MPVSDCDNSISKDSVFDWGQWGGGSSSRSLNLNNANRKGSIDTSDKTRDDKHYHASSRYDPRAMNRIDNIDDLIDEDDSDSSEEYDVEKLGGGSGRSKRSSSISSSGVNMATNARRAQNGSGAHESRLIALRYRRIFAITSLIAIIVGASVAIGLAVTKSGLSDENTAATSLNVLGGSGLPNNVASSSSDGTNNAKQQQTLLETAERVIQSCSENSLDRDMSACQSLCRARMCCFESEESEYSCMDDVSKECAVYAGCEALVDGSVEGFEMEEEG